MGIVARPYYSQGGASTAFYDLVTAADRDLTGDVDLYADLCPVGGTVLELGAGTGRISQALAELGLSVVGLDLSDPMLAQAEAKRAVVSPEIAQRLRYVRGDMTSLALGQTFDAVICPFFALAHVPPSAWRAVFRGVSRHLRPGGLAAFHMPIAEKMGGAPPPPDLPVFRREAGDGAVLTLYVAGQVFQQSAGRLELTLDYVVARNGVEERQRERLVLYSGDPDPMAAAAGLIIDRPAVPLGASGSVAVYRRLKAP